MNIDAIRKGDVFVECTPEQWEAMTPAERRKAKTVEAEGYLGPCRTQLERIHIRTSRGDWCIARVAPVVLLEKVAAKPAAKTRKAA